MDRDLKIMQEILGQVMYVVVSLLHVIHRQEPKFVISDKLASHVTTLCVK